MKIDKTIVEHVAILANLKLELGQAAKFSDQLSKILDYIDQLNQVETTSVVPTFNVSTNLTVMAEDKVQPSLSQAEALANATKAQDGWLVTKGVFEDE
jgi:aspartyl-tRNA(Asn)/glutamyl-tRNA(Gln) amidotransferase subunit C